MSQPPSPLYNLPHLVRHEVIKAMDLLELLTLSRVSRKSCTLVKSATKMFLLSMLISAKQEENFVVFRFGEKSAKLKIETPNLTSGFVRQSINGGKTTVPRDIQYNTDDFIIYGNDKVKGFIKAIKLLVDVFNAKFALFDFDNQLQSTIKQVLACTKMHQLKTRILFISGAGLTNSAFNLMLEESRHAFELVILIKSFHRLNINDPQNLPLRNQQMNSFLEKWMVEKWDMRSMVLSLYDNFDLRMAVEGLNAEIAKEIASENGEIRMLQPGDGYTIQRNDGVKATVCYFDKHFIMKIDH